MNAQRKRKGVGEMHSKTFVAVVVGGGDLVVCV
jgi:hypothetical protein